MVCWSCHGPTGREDLFCKTCHVVQPPAPVDHFTRLDMAEDFDIDPAELAQKYIAKQRLLHPDRFVGKTEKEKAFAQMQTVAMNESHDVLKSSLKRAIHLAALHGFMLGDEEGQTINDPEILMEAMQKQDHLERSSLPGLRELEEQARQDITRTELVLTGLFTAGKWEKIIDEILRLKYQSKFLQNIKQKQMKFN